MQILNTRQYDWDKIKKDPIKTNKLIHCFENTEMHIRPPPPPPPKKENNKKNKKTKKHKKPQNKTKKNTPK